MKRIIAIILLSMFVPLATMTVAVAAEKAKKDYFKLYKEYKHKYQNTKKQLRKAEKQRDDYGNQNESTYLDLVQCQRTAENKNRGQLGPETITELTQ